MRHFGVRNRAREHPVEVLQRVRPDIALVAHELLQDGKRGRFAIDRLHEFDGAYDGCYMRKRRGFREEAAHLDFGVDARIEPPVALQKQLAAEEHAGIALLEGWNAYFFLDRRGQRGVDRSRHEAQARAAQRDVLPFADGSRQRA